MEEINTMEQPTTEIIAEVSEPITDENKGQLNEVEGSMFGKFKDATSLLQAYSSLEKEFTRKSQKLAELKKTLDDLNVQKPQINAESCKNKMILMKASKY